MSPSQLKLVIVEDSIDLSAIWKILFQTAGYDPVICHTGKSMMDLLDTGFVPDLVLTDYYLPDITGMDLIQEIKNRNLNSPCIMVTGNRDSDFCANILGQSDVMKLLHKPVKFESLKNEVDQFILQNY